MGNTNRYSIYNRSDDHYDRSSRHARIPSIHPHHQHNGHHHLRNDYADNNTTNVCRNESSNNNGGGGGGGASGSSQHHTSSLLSDDQSSNSYYAINEQMNPSANHLVDYASNKYSTPFEAPSTQQINNGFVNDDLL